MPILSEAGVPLSAWIRRGLAVPVETPSEVTEPLVKALRDITEDPSFQEQTEAQGMLAAWSDGPTWTSQMRDEAQELGKLWASDPWLNGAGQ